MSHPIKPFEKPALPPEELLAHLQSRGLIVPDPDAALEALRRIGYYRLLIYMRPLQEMPEKRFREGTTFDDVLALYDFDRELRLLCMDAVERVEVALRSAIVYELTVPHGPHFYLESRHFESFDRYREFLQTASSARNLAVQHYTSRYNTPSPPPLWTVMEAVTYGSLSRLYSGLHREHRKAVAKWFGFDESVLVSWFRSINALRNMCAHHNRVWNFDMRVDQPKAARALAHELGRTNTLYARLVVLAALLGSAGPASTWKQRLVSLLARYPGVPAEAMGFPPDWARRLLSM